MVKKLLFCLLFLLPVFAEASPIHVLESNTEGKFNVVIHEAIPGGNNSADVSWQTAYCEWKKSVAEDGTISSTDSVLHEGTGAGQITAAERVQVRNCDLIEINTVVYLGTVSAGALTEQVNKAIDDTLDQLAIKLKWYGYTQ